MADTDRPTGDESPPASMEKKHALVEGEAAAMIAAFAKANRDKLLSDPDVIGIATGKDFDPEEE